jgi:hypothetical protein
MCEVKNMARLSTDRIFGVIFVLVTLLVTSWIPAVVSAEELVVTRALICLDVKDRVPVGEAEEFPPTVTRVFCFTCIEGAKVPTQVTHVWSYKGEKMREITLPVNSIRWRTWSYKNISPSQVGPWRVDIIDGASQKVIKTVEFSIH